MQTKVAAEMGIIPTILLVSSMDTERSAQVL
jgi:hypothetical protein